MTLAKRHKLKGVTDKFVDDVAGLFRNYIGSNNETKLEAYLNDAFKVHAKDNNKIASAARVHQLLRKKLSF